MITAASAILLSPMAHAAKLIPYATTLCADPDWKVVNVDPSTKAWMDGDDYYDFRNTGFEEGKYYKYDRSNPADDWLISPAIQLEAGKEYKVSFMLRASSDMERLSLSMAADTTILSLSAPGAIIYDYDGETTKWHKVSRVVSLPATGEIHFGIHAFSPEDLGTIYITGFDVRENVFIPASVSDLTVEPDRDGAVSASLSWKLPSTDADGAPIPDNAVFDKVTVSRDGVLIATLDGNATAFTDTEADGLTAGKHVYSVCVTVNGKQSAPVEITSRHIGPVALKELPWTAGVATLDSDTFGTEYTVIKGSASAVPSSYGWMLKSGAIQFYPRSRYNREDDWLVLPKVKFDKAGIYRLRVSASYDADVAPLIEVKAGSARSIEAMDMDLGVFDALPASKGDAYVAFEIKEPAELHLALHAAREEAGSAAYVKFYELTVEETVALPTNVTGLKATIEGKSARLAWKAPGTDNLGRPLAALTKIELYRGDSKIKEFTDPAPGAEMDYLDTPEQGGVYIYKVIPYIGESVPDTGHPTVNAGWVGDKTQNLPYTLDFSDAVDSGREKSLWEIVNRDGDSYNWSFGTSALTLKLDADGGTADDILLTPPFELPAGEYDVLVRAKGGESGFPLNIGYMLGSDPYEFVAEPSQIALSGKNSYADYEAVVKVEAPANARFAIATSPEHEYGYDPYNVMVQKISVTPRQTDPTVGIDRIGNDHDGSEEWYGLDGVRVRNPQKGNIYIVRDSLGKTRKVVR